MKSIIVLILIIITNSCNRENDIVKETQNRILLHKEFIKEISFEGLIAEKLYCNECNFNKYQIKIKLDEGFTKKIEIGNLSFPPYYSFTNNDEIILSVNKNLYEKSHNGIKVRKLKDSENLLIEKNDYELISQKKYEWIP